MYNEGIRFQLRVRRLKGNVSKVEIATWATQFMRPPGLDRSVFDLFIYLIEGIGLVSP